MIGLIEPNRKPRKLTSEEVVRLLSYNQNDITMSNLTEMLAYRKNTPPLFDVGDTFMLGIGKRFNSDIIKTTVGRFVLNTLVLSPKLGDLIGYQNYTFDGSGIGRMDDIMAGLLRDDKITTTEFATYLDQLQWLGFGMTKFLNSSLTTELIIPSKAVQEKKAELLEKYADGIKNANPTIVGKFEQELLDLAKVELEGHPSMEIYNSGARGSFNNNFKNVNIARGLIPSLVDPTKYEVSTASLYDGISPEEQYKFADIMTGASLSRAIGTRTGGLKFGLTLNSFN